MKRLTLLAIANISEFPREQRERRRHSNIAGRAVPALPAAGYAARTRTSELALYSIIVTAKMKDVDPQVPLADVLARIADHPVHRLDDLPPWN